MQLKEHKRFSNLPAGKQVWNEQASLFMSYCYVPVGAGFTAIINMSNDDKIRPWFKRYEA